MIDSDVRANMNHIDEVLRLLETQIRDKSEVSEIRHAAEEVAEKWVDPLSGGKEETNGLLYGLVQSGKTGVLTATGAIGADQGYKTVLILTSDNDALYEQTLGRVREAFPGLDVISRQEFKDQESFIQRVRFGTSAIVTSKNANHLRTLVENFKFGKVKGLSCLIVDDEADQASLNTQEHKADGTKSKINELITALRRYFEKNTYLQVTATPQALFLQTRDHDFRPKFTVLSHPGSDYVGGDDFFGENSNLVREFDIHDITLLAAGSQPSPSLNLPASLLRALDTFMLAATHKRMKEADQNCAFLCHVSTKTADHNYIVNLLRQYKTDLPRKLQTRSADISRRFQTAYDDLATTFPKISEQRLDDLLTRIQFYSPGITVKLVNGQTDEDVSVKAPYNFFVGGNKLGRGVTIRNLLVSYYGRNPKRPQADTVLQHARMYGYRRKDIGLLRLFLPKELHVVFRAINRMEKGLRESIEDNPSEEFRGVYVESALIPTRKSILAPGAIGIYSGGGTYNPAQVLRDESVTQNTSRVDKLVDRIASKTYVVQSTARIAELVELCSPDQSQSERIWDTSAVAESIRELAAILKQKDGYVYVDRGRDQRGNRRETQGILTGGEAKTVPDDRVTLFLLKMRAHGNETESWWPQIRFPAGKYAFAFSV